MIYIVHGEDISKSRALIINHQKKLQKDSVAGVAKVNLDIKNTSPEQLYEQCISGSLFGERPLVVLDITDAKKTDLDSYIEKLTKIPEDTTLIIYASKPLTKTNSFIAAADTLKAKIVENNTFSDANVFKFTDALFSKNREASYKELNKLYAKDYDSFYIFSMIVYTLRSLAKMAWQAPSVQKLKPFQISKIQGMLKRFSGTQIRTIFDYYYTLEKKAKTGLISPEMMITLAVEKVLKYD